VAVAWPRNLIQRIADGQWLLFIGSGISASCTNKAGASPPTWEQLLLRLATLITDAANHEIAKQLIGRNDFLGAADHIRWTLSTEANIDSYYQEIRSAVNGPPDDRFTPSGWFEALLSLEPRVVYTTNYDNLFEMASDHGYVTHPFTSTGIPSDFRRGEPLLVKLHGSVDQINEVVLTRTDFARATRTGREAFAVLSAASLTSTILFVGYSLHDPDIQLVLQAVGRERLSPEAHFMLTSEPASPSQKSVYEETYGVSLLTYPAGNHDQGIEALWQLGGSVLAQRERARAGS
jgi:hypothetical protein